MKKIKPVVWIVFFIWFLAGTASFVLCLLGKGDAFGNAFIAGVFAVCATIAISVAEDLL